MPSQLSLTTGVLAAPVITLVAHEGIYLASMQSCHGGSSVSAHLVPAVALLLIVAVIRLAWRDWQATRNTSGVVPRKSLQAELALADSQSNTNPQDVFASKTLLLMHPRGHLLATTGMSIGVFCALVTLAQWLAVIMLGPCTRQL